MKQQKLKQKKWVVRECGSHKDLPNGCWCRIINTIDGESIINAGRIGKEDAEYFTELHNNSLNTRQPQSIGYHDVDEFYQDDEDQPQSLTDEMIKGLGKLYIDNKLLIAKLCDEVLDKSGGLLGEVRKWARDQQPNCIFETSTDTSSATICKHCGREKWEHQQPTPVVSEEELRINAHKGLEEEWTQIERIRFVDGFFACHEWLQSRPQANEGLFKEEDK